MSAQSKQIMDIQDRLTQVHTLTLQNRADIEEHKRSRNVVVIGRRNTDSKYFFCEECTELMEKSGKGAGSKGAKGAGKGDPQNQYKKGELEEKFFDQIYEVCRQGIRKVRNKGAVKATIDKAWKDADLSDNPCTAIQHIKETKKGNASRWRPEWIVSVRDNAEGRLLKEFLLTECSKLCSEQLIIKKDGNGQQSWAVPQAGSQELEAPAYGDQEEMKEELRKEAWWSIAGNQPGNTTEGSVWSTIKSFAKKNEATENESQENLKKACWPCGKLGHRAAECPEKGDDTSNTQPVCWKCGMKGHLSRNCRQKGKWSWPSWSRNSTTDDADDASPGA